MTLALLLLSLVLIGLGPAAPFLPETIARRAGAACCVLGIALAVARLLGVDTPDLDLGGLRLRLDGLSAWLVVPVLIAGATSILAGERAGPIGAMVLALLAGHPLLLLAALVVLGLALWVRTVSLPIWALCSALGFALGGAQLYALPLLFALAGLVALWRGLLRGEAGRFASALSALGVYVLARITLDLSGLATPVWYGVVVCCFGLVGAVLGGWRAAIAEAGGALIPAASVLSGGLACAGLGVALAARGADLPPVAALGLEAALLQVVSQAATLGLLALGGATGGAALGAASLAALPPTAGFASLYLLLQALFAATRIGGVGLQFACACAVAAVGAAAALGALAALRMLANQVSSGPPVPPDVRIGALACAAVGAVLGIAPGEALLLTRPAVQRLVPAGLVDVSLWVPAVVAALLVGGFVGVRQATRAQVRRAPSWQGGVQTAPNLVPYAPALLAGLRLPRPEPRVPRLREWLGLAAAALALVLIVLAAR